MSALEFNETEHRERETLFADILLPLPIPHRYTYRIPFQLNEKILRGIRVIVQFGKKKILTGIVDKIHDVPPKNYSAKLILDILDEEPTLNEIQLKLIDWMSDYYMCYPGEVLNAALPSGLKLHSESKVQLHNDPDLEEEEEYNETEIRVVDALRKDESLSYSDIAQLLGTNNIYGVLKSLLEKNKILLFEEVKDRYSPKIEKRIVLRPEYRENSKLEGLFADLSMNPKQEAVVLFYLQRVENFASEEGIPKNSFSREKLSNSSLKTLIKNGVFEIQHIQIPRFRWGGEYEPVNLSEYQSEKRDAILSHFEQNHPVLLHGITGSGKTEIYVDLISHALDEGQQVLYLLPEIALTTQIVNRLKKSFGNTIGVYHSRYSDNERVEVWKAVQSGELKFVVGVRSSLFLPFDNLGLIIIDEEHESSYKQFSPAPRYHGRDVAIMLAHFHNARVLLGSATPSLESYFNAKTERFGLVQLDQRYGKAELPEYQIVDIQQARKRRKVRGQFSNVLIDKIEQAIGKGEQVIIFQNRRGYAPLMECEDCSWVPKCFQCSVSLTYHQYRQELRCHYCGFKQALPSQCEACGSVKLKTVGVGTEKLEEDLNLLFPSTVVKRMDLDTTRSKSSYETILNEFEAGRIQILVGTQMLSKGLDFDHVSLVGVIDLDRMLHFPDFRAHERSYQLTVQVGGRAGRREKKGEVVVQTRQPDQVLIPMIVQNKYQDFYQYEMAERNRHHYPPYTRIIKITVKHRGAQEAKFTAQQIANALRPHLGKERVLGPEEPMVYRIRNFYLQDILIKLDRDLANLGNIKKQIRKTCDLLLHEKEHKGCRVIYDVDPS